MRWKSGVFGMAQMIKKGLSENRMPLYPMDEISISQ